MGVGPDLAELLLPVEVPPALADIDGSPGSRVAWQEGGRLAARRSRARGSGRRLRLHDDDLADGCSALDRLAAHLSRARSRGSRRSLELGEQDITCEVALDQLAAVRPPSVVRDQRSFLTAHGVEQLVDEGRRVWERGAAQGGLAASAGSQPCARGRGAHRTRWPRRVHRCRVGPMKLYDASPVEDDDRRRASGGVATGRRTSRSLTIRSRGITCAICVRPGAW